MVDIGGYLWSQDVFDPVQYDHGLNNRSWGESVKGKGNDLWFVITIFYVVNYWFFSPGGVLVLIIFYILLQFKLNEELRGKILIL